MQFSDTTGKQGLIQDITFLTGKDLNAYTIEDRTRNINQRYNMVWQIIFDAYGGWKWQDDNSNALPYADVNVVNGTPTGSLPAGTLTIREAALKSADGVYRRLSCITEEEYFQMGGDAQWNGITGTPQYILPYEDTWRLLPTVNYTLASALRIYFDAGITSFTAADTTQVPGFASTYHRILSVGASLDYALMRIPSKVVPLTNLWNDYSRMITSFYKKRYQARYPGVFSGGQDLMEEFA